MDFLYKSKNAVVINKPALIPSQADRSGDSDAMSLASCALREGGERSDLWLVHRLDRVVGGAMLFARNKRSAALISSAISADMLNKEYVAIVEGKPTGGEMRDYIYKDAKSGRSIVVGRDTRGAREAYLTYKLISTVESAGTSFSLVLVNLHTGRFHQIRTQFSHRGFPIVGDGKYGSKLKCPEIALFSHKLSLSVESENISASVLPNTDNYPWNLFSNDVYMELVK